MRGITPDERKWIKKRFPNLCLNGSFQNLSIAGEFIVDMFYDPLSDGYVIFPDASMRTSDRYIRDVYTVKIEYDDASFIPAVYETAGRIKTFAHQKRILLADLHVNDMGRLCLCPKPLEKIRLGNSYTIQDFFAHLVVPFFYAHSFYEKFNRWPWKDYSHGDTGVLEAYAEHLLKIENKVSFTQTTIESLNENHQKVLRNGDLITRQTLCFCDSGKKFRLCHHQAWVAAKKLKEILLSS